MNYQALGGYSFMHIIESVSCIAAVPKERRDVWQFWVQQSPSSQGQPTKQSLTALSEEQTIRF